LRRWSVAQKKRMPRLDIAHTLDCIEEIAAYWVMIVRGFRWAAGACQVLFERALNPVQFNTKLAAASYCSFANHGALRFLGVAVTLAQHNVAPEKFQCGNYFLWTISPPI
jgi:hypothetical protein